MVYGQRFSEYAALLGSIHPASHSTEQNTGYLSLAQYARAAVVIHCGVIGGNLDVDIEQATDTAGASAKAFDANAKDITKTATTDNNTVSVIEVRGEEFDTNGGFGCLNVEITPAAAGIFAVEVWGLEPRYAPVSVAALDSVTD